MSDLKFYTIKKLSTEQMVETIKILNPNVEITTLVNNQHNQSIDTFAGTALITSKPIEQLELGEYKRNISIIGEIDEQTFINLFIKNNEENINNQIKLGNKQFNEFINKYKRTNDAIEISEQLYNIGFSLIGTGNPKDLEKSMFLMKQSAKLGNKYANFIMSWFYANAIGVERNYEIAMQYLKKANEKNNISILSDLMKRDLKKINADMSNNKKFSVDPKKDYNIQGTDDKIEDDDITNVSDSLFEKGNSLLGTGDQTDLQEALYYLDWASKLGNKSSNYVLGNIFANAIGVEQDLNKAINYYQKSEDNEQTKSKILEIENILKIHGQEYKTIQSIDYTNNNKSISLSNDNSINGKKGIKVKVTKVSKGPSDELEEAKKTISKLVKQNNELTKIIEQYKSLMEQVTKDQEEMLEQARNRNFKG